jgi:hypothetical protein
LIGRASAQKENTLTMKDGGKDKSKKRGPLRPRLVDVAIDRLR